MISKKILGKKGSVALTPSVVSSTDEQSLLGLPEMFVGDLSYSVLDYSEQVPAFPYPYQGTGFGKLKSTQLKVDTLLHPKGLSLTLTQDSFSREFKLFYPAFIWDSFPNSSKLVLRDHISLLSTMELGIMHELNAQRYNTPMPLLKSFFMELLVRNLFYCGDADKDKINAYLARFSRLQYSFEQNVQAMRISPFLTTEGSVNTLTFGKESLVCFGLSKEIGLNPKPVTITEPDWNYIYKGETIRTFENKHKSILIDAFEKEFAVSVHKVHNNFGYLRSFGHWGMDVTELGWTSQLTEYLFFLLPFNYYYRSKYMVFGNEYSCDSSYVNNEGYKCSVVYDQSSEWVSHMDVMLRALTRGSVQVTSLVQPLHEIAVTKVLYQRYPELAKYQLSCHVDFDSAEYSRWCGQCSKCARCYVFMKALGFDPALVGLKEMSTQSHKKYFSLFKTLKEMRGFDSLGFGRDEQLFAFFLAVERGVSGELFDLFKKKYYKEAKKREESLRKEFFTVHEPTNIPPELWKKLKPIFEEELSR